WTDLEFSRPCGTVLPTPPTSTGNPERSVVESAAPACRGICGFFSLILYENASAAFLVFAPPIHRTGFCRHPRCHESRPARGYRATARADVSRPQIHRHPGSALVHGAHREVQR